MAKETVRVVCNLKRFGGTVIDFEGKKYHFKPEGVDKQKPTEWPEDAQHVCEIPANHSKLLKRLASPAMNGAYDVPGVSPDAEKAAELKFKEADTADTLDVAIAKVGDSLIDGEYQGREDYVAAQMAGFYGVEKSRDRQEARGVEGQRHQGTRPQRGGQEGQEGGVAGGG
jgi:hypothetical protein